MSSTSSQGEVRAAPGSGSRRPDGTYRKERRIREGYVPQEEQPVYMSKGALAKQNVPICPGFEPEEAKAAAMTKNQRKNEKKKEQRKSGATEPKPEQPKPSPSAAPDVGSVTAGMQQLSTTTPPAAPNAEFAQVSPAERLQKDHRNILKKIRQAEGLAEKLKLGQNLTKEEMEKVGKLTGWNTEAQALEQEIRKLS
mmetsp:Transcript_28130/g.75955  ORF Transcript_28130/g.75955 Transcript_28130/m.75955 type:complete len:196 (-) Transcript_28130:529-1116(-)|eukprot:CAMPEP_0202381192 /NCGR_PEP_ID=MMETSP1127-20130417/33917_1 /ASSEMBLY_ACC=CAM_ASM_000462 /TAXON_ID=3047 /ORGANISM="Dunaliella tertiolecta, Strain CCMP1320" /LENGTH=195 /DNA_ID=CAMNT_0048980081 /DNA_START=61 /DNA_END=648 /DNA_ORIENTATION=-